MVGADPKPAPENEPIGRKAWSGIRQKLDQLLRNKDNKALDPYRVEVESIIDTLDAVNRDAEGLRGRGSRGG